MSLPLIIRPEAEQDMAKGQDWYDKQRTGLGNKFLDAVEEVFDHIREFPELYAVEYRGVRPIKLCRFPYVVYYRITRESIEVLGVLHGSRHPHSWRSRAK